MSPFAITVVVRSHNDEAYIGATLDMLTRQTEKNLEILCVDDGSTDRTVAIIDSFAAVRRVAAPSPYVPGRVLNFAVREAAGDTIVFNNSDAVPQHEDYIERLIAPLAFPDTGAVYGNQLCRPDADPLVRKDYERAFGDGRIAATWRHFFSMASSAARREVLIANPFDETLQYSEDIEWSYRLKKRGFQIVYAPDARVEHSHNYTMEQLWKRFYNEGRADAAIFGDAPSFPRFAAQLARECGRDLAYLCRRGEFAAAAGCLPRRFIQKYAAYRGCADGLAERPRRA